MSSEQLEAERSLFQEHHRKVFGHYADIDCGEESKKRWSLWQAARSQPADGTVMVTQEDGNNYCLILTALGMEEEGDPVAEVKRLVALSQQPAAPRVVSDAQIDHAIMIHEGVKSIPKGGWGDKSRERMRAALEAIAPAPAANPVDDLVNRFAEALREKLHASEAKHGYKNAWLRDDWQDALVVNMHAHIKKGDPRDVAAYCAFAWHHGWALSGPLTLFNLRAIYGPEGRQQPAQPSAPSPGDIAYLIQADHDFEACGETSVPYKALVRLEGLGLLQCEHFTVTEQGEKLIAAHDGKGE